MGDAIDTTAIDTAAGQKQPKKKSTFMLHDPISMGSICKLNAQDWRYSALKVASRINKMPESTKGEEEGTIKIWLRKTNTKLMREYIGRVITLETPQEVLRAGRKITYTKRPQVKFVRSWLWDDAALLPAGGENKDEEETATVSELRAL